MQGAFVSRDIAAKLSRVRGLSFAATPKVLHGAVRSTGKGRVNTDGEHAADNAARKSFSGKSPGLP